MSDCKICFHKSDGKVMQRPVSGECAVCNPKPELPIEDACICPPLGEPKYLPVIAPVIFDECGINLCREVKIPERIINAFPTTDTMELKVIDIDFCMEDPCGSKVETLQRRPNCVKVKLSHIMVKFAVKFLDIRCRVLGEDCFQAEYLTDCDCPQYDEDTNPSSVTVELYAPYGVSYFGGCVDCIPSINFLGFIECPNRNNSLRQGIVSQALAKVVDLDFCAGCVAIGISIYLKSVYFVQYRVKHAGLCVPPKCIPIEECGDACKDFVEGDLLEQSIQPLEVCTKPKTISPCYEPVEDPTPSEEDKHKKGRHR